MPWKKTCEMDEKIRFVLAYLSGEGPMTELAAAYGISRKAGYAAIARYRLGGFAGLEPRSRAPHRHGRAMPAEQREAILALRRDRPRWGPKKLRAELQRRWPDVAWPAPSTIGDLLHREGLSGCANRRRPRAGARRELTPAAAPNAVWCTDFKGWFRTRDGVRCDPLTVSDQHSRYLLGCRIVQPTAARVRPVFEDLFRSYGLPAVMRSDNGPPFSSSAVAGLSRLNVWWIKLGIRIELIDPGQPQQNGRHERLHRTLKDETAAPPAASREAQQARFDAFCEDYNRHRPHEALGQRMPAEQYAPSPRPYPARLLEPWYDADHEVRRVRPTGEIKWRGKSLFLSETLRGEYVGLREMPDGHWLVRYFDYELAVIDARTQKMRPIGPARPGRPNGAQSENTVTHPSG